MSGATSVVMAVAAVAGAAISYQNGQEQKKSAEKAASQAQANAQKQEKAADEATNRAVHVDDFDHDVLKHTEPRVAAE